MNTRQRVAAALVLLCVVALASYGIALRRTRVSPRRRTDTSKLEPGKDAPEPLTDKRSPADIWDHYTRCIPALAAHPAGGTIRILHDHGSGPERKLVFRFTGADGTVPAEGLFVLHYRCGEKTYSHCMLPIVAGRAEAVLPAPNRFTFRPSAVPGCWFRPRMRPVDLPVHDDPLEIVVQTQPAGVIYGRIGSREGAGVAGRHVAVRVMSRHEDVPHLGVDGFCSDRGAYLTGGLPFGSTYRILAMVDTTAMMSPFLSIDRRAPTARWDFVLPEDTIDIRGVVLQHDGTPVAGISTRLTFSWYAGGAGSHGWDIVKTDADGRFRIDGINPDVPADGRYDITVNRDYPNTRYVGIRVEAHLDGRPHTIRLRGR
jgi:hypothetical protein